MATKTNEIPQIKIVDVLTGEEILRDMTTEELSQFEADKLKSSLQKAAEEAQVAARQSALAKLAELGLTEEEIAAL